MISLTIYQQKILRSINFLSMLQQSLHPSLVFKKPTVDKMQFALSY